MNRTDVLSAIFASLFLFVFVGYVGLSEDNTQYLLGAYKLSDPGFLENDWFVQKTQSFQPFFEYYVLWWLKSDAIIAGLFVWFVVNLLLLSAALIVWLRTLGVTERMPFAVIITVAILLVGVRQGWGQYEILTGKALPAYLAYPTALLAIVLLFHRRFFASACAVAVTFVIHHGLGALLVLCLAGPFLVTLPQSRQEFIRTGLGALVVAIVFLPLVFGTVNLDSGHAEDFAIFFYGRAPQHYAIQYFSLSTHLASLHIFAVAILLASMLPSSELRAKILALVSGIAILCLLGYVFLEVWYVPVFVRLFPYRALPILIAINACAIAFFLLRQSSTRTELLTVIAVFISGVAYYFSLVGWAAFLGIAIVLRFLPRGDVIAPTQRRAGLILICAIGAVALTIQRHIYSPQYFVEPPSVTYSALREAMDKHTPKDAIIVVPPWIVGARLIIDRAIVVNTKAFPVYASEMAEWADRIRDITGVDPRNGRAFVEKGANVWQLYARGYQEQTVKDLVGAARKYGADFLLVSTHSLFHFQAERAGLPALWSGFELVLYRTPEVSG